MIHKKFLLAGIGAGILLLTSCSNQFQAEDKTMSNNILFDNESLSSSIISTENAPLESLSLIESNSSASEKAGQNLLGGMSPERALEYLKNTSNVVIVQVNTAQWKIEPGFIGALWIPHDEISERYNEIPEDCPVMLHCGAGVVSVPAYETLIEKRPDIPELSYIAGRPHEIMEEYNKWLAKQ